VSNEFFNALSDVEGIMEQKQSFHLIVGGDCNVDLARNTAHVNHFQDWLERSNLTDQWVRFREIERYTYCDLGLKAFSCIDRWMVSNDLPCSDARPLHEATNPSKHSSIGLSVQIPGHLESGRSAPVNQNHNTRIEWHKPCPLPMNSGAKWIA
jgi:hypothetical protein